MAGEQARATEQDGSASDSDEDDYEIFDSDYDAEDGDDDLFADNVDKSVNNHNEKEICVDLEDDDAIDDDELNLGEDKTKHLKNKIKAFDPEIDMDNPTFRFGMLFSGVEEVRKALSTYSIRNRVKITKVRNERRKLETICVPGCPWMLKSSNDTAKTGGFIITAYNGNDMCERAFPVKSITAKILKEKFMHEFRDN
jgi:hypothetical protein